MTIFRRMCGLPAEGRAEAARFLVDLGFQAVVVSAASTVESVQPALDAGLAVWAYRGAFSIRPLAEDEAAPLLARDVDGTPRIWFNSGCPNQRALRDAHLTAIERLVRAGAFAGFLLDGIRFASPNAGDGYFTCFCDVCRGKARGLGFDFERIRRDVAALRDWCRSSAPAPLAAAPIELPERLARWPGVIDWLRFRAACVVEHVGEVRQAIDNWSANRSVPFQLGAYLFTPSFARLVGQRYGALAPLLDVVSPMIYRTDAGGDSCLTPEWAALARLSLVPPHGEFSAEDVGTEVARARALLPAGKMLVPIIRLADDQVVETTRLTLQAGAGGVDYFVFRGSEDEPYVRKAAAAAEAGS